MNTARTAGKAKQVATLRHGEPCAHESRHVATVPRAESQTAYEQLTSRRRKFVDALVLGMTQAGAARAAGYSKARPNVMGSSLMAQPLVRKAVEERRAQAAIDAGVEASAVLMRLVAIATNPKAKTADRLRADELLGRHLKLFTDKHEHAGVNGAPLPTAAPTAPVILMTVEAAQAIARQLLEEV